MITACIVNKNGKTCLKNIENNLETYYKLIDCDTIDIVSRKFEDRYLDIICDDCGLFTDNPVITAVDLDNQPMLVGTLIIVKHDGEGETISLEQEDITAIQHCLRMCIDSKGQLRKIIRCSY